MKLPSCTQNSEFPSLLNGFSSIRINNLSHQLFLGVFLCVQCHSVFLWIQLWLPDGPGSQDTKYFWIKNVRAIHQCPHSTHPSSGHHSFRAPAFGRWWLSQLWCPFAMPTGDVRCTEGKNSQDWLLVLSFDLLWDVWGRKIGHQDTELTS